MEIPKMSVKEFTQNLREQIGKIGEEYSWNIDNNTYRGYAFQRWITNLILTLEPGFDTSPDEAMLYSNDLGADLFFEDTPRSHLLIVQCKYDKIGTAVDEGEVNDFFNRHEKFANHDWVMRHGSSSAKEAFSDYGEKIENGFSSSYYFFSTADASPRTHDLANNCSKSYEKRNIPVKCELYDFTKLKDYYIRSQSVELSGPKEVTIMLTEKRFFEKKQPYPTVITVKGNSLRNLYQQHKESLYAWNIRGYLGNRGINQEIRETAESSPEHFSYFNNGVSAICTEYWINGNELKIEDFKIINGAQTISSLIKAKANSDIDVLFRLTKTLSVKTEKGINRDIIKYNNSQNVVRISDFRSNDEIQLWLERRFDRWNASPVLGRIHYQRKRAIGKKKFGDSVKLEDFAKIRYAFLYEPTLVFYSPKQFWASKEDGGAYEKAFGVQNEMTNSWSDGTFEECLLSIAVFNTINKEIQDKIKKTADLRFLWRLKYHALSMFGLYYRENQKSLEFHNLLRNKPDFDSFYNKLSKIAFSVLSDVYSIAEEQKQSLFALVRSDERWEQMKKRFTRQLSIAS